MSAVARARGISLWLMPEGAEKERLAALIARLAARLDTASFAPHVTLLPGLPGEGPDVLKGARVLAGEVAPLPIELLRVDGADAHFRCLFFRVRPFGSLRDAHDRAARQFGQAPDPSFEPHLSLVYGSLTAPLKAQLARELERETATRFEARRLHVWQTEGPVATWQPLGSFALGDV